MPGPSGLDGFSTSTLLAIAAITVPSVITVFGLLLHAAYVAGRLSPVLKAVENIYAVLGTKVNKDDYQQDITRLDGDIDDAHSKANTNATAIGTIKGKMNGNAPP